MVECVEHGKRCCARAIPPLTVDFAGLARTV
jgi:hypothetical protein